jgi:hypothetical protein
MRNCIALIVLAAWLSGCGRPPAARDSAPLPRALPLEVLADRAPDASLPPSRVPSVPAARLELLRISPEREPVPMPPPEAAPAEPPPAAAAGEALPNDDRLRPPVPRGGTSLRLAGTRGGWVELDVRVDETGAVSDAELAAAGADSALVSAAIAAARATRWYPARRAGHAVAVWSRQRFEVGR